jgi:hypothetical protein
VTAACEQNNTMSRTVWPLFSSAPRKNSGSQCLGMPAGGSAPGNKICEEKEKEFPAALPSATTTLPIRCVC